MLYLCRETITKYYTGQANNSVFFITKFCLKKTIPKCETVALSTVCHPCFSSQSRGYMDCGLWMLYLCRETITKYYTGQANNSVFFLTKFCFKKRYQNVKRCLCQQCLTPALVHSWIHLSVFSFLQEHT